MVSGGRKGRCPAGSETDSGEDTMMKRAMIAMMLLAIPTMAFAQGGGQRGQRGPRGPMMLGAGQGPLALVLEKKADLNLSDRQVTQIEAMQTALAAKNEPHVAKMEELREAEQRDREAMMEVMQSIRANNMAAHASLQDVLDEEQFELANKLIAEATPRGRRGGGRR
jgi:hypothetical protein